MIWTLHRNSCYRCFSFCNYFIIVFCLFDTIRSLKTNTSQLLPVYDACLHSKTDVRSQLWKCFNCFKANFRSLINSTLSSKFILYRIRPWDIDIYCSKISTTRSFLPISSLLEHFSCFLLKYIQRPFKASVSFSNENLKKSSNKKM